MRAALALAALVVVALSLALARRAPEALGEVAREALGRALVVAPVVALALFVVGLMERLLPREALSAWLGGASGWRGLGLAWLAGVLTPGGPLLGLPLAAALHAAGAERAVVVTYLCSLSLLNLTRLPVEGAILGPRLLAWRLAAGLALPLVAGALVRALRG